MSTPTSINEEYDIVIAGGEPSKSSTSQSFLPAFILLTTWASECDRRHCCVRRCWSTRCGRRESANPLTRSGSDYAQQSCTHPTCKLPKPPCARLAHRTCVRFPTERGTWRSHYDRTNRAVFWRQWQRQLYVSRLFSTCVQALFT